MNVEYLSILEACFWMSCFAAPWGALLAFRRMSYFGDAVGHSSLLGVAVAYLLWGLFPLTLALGALAAVVSTFLLTDWLQKKGRMPADLSLTVSYAGMFSLGLVLLSRSSMQLQHFLIGDIQGMSSGTLWFFRFWALIVVGILIFFWRPFWAITQDERFAQTLGYHPKRLNMLFVAVTSITVVALMQTVGALLVTAFLVFPAVSAFPWTRSFRGLVFMAGIFGFSSSLLGVALAQGLTWSLGPSISLSGFLMALASHILALSRSR